VTRTNIFTINALSRLLRLRALSEPQRPRKIVLLNVFGPRRRAPTVAAYDGPILTDVEYRVVTDNFRVG
jgi:hypothetical protein